MKTTLRLTIAALGLAIFSLSAFVAEAQFSYIITNGTITMTGGCPSSPGAVTIPETINGLPVTTVGDRAFYECANLTSVTIPNSVTSIGDYAFAYCTGLTSIAVDSANPNYSSLDGVLFNKSQTTLLLCPGGKAGSYSIPNSATSIGGAAFLGCINLTSIVIPNSVTSIPGLAFYDCTSLTSITIPNSVTNIGGYAFAVGTSLKGAYFQGNAPTYYTGDYPPFTGAYNVTVYYLPGTTGWGSTYAWRPTALWVLPYPVILTTPPNFGLQTNGFGFRISWATNVPVVIESATTLANPVWSAVSTNALTNGWSDFRGAEWTNHSTRFYRVRSP